MKILEELRLQRDKAYQEKRIKLLELYGTLPQPLLDEALTLIKKPYYSLSNKEQDLIKFIDFLCRGEITAQKYIEFQSLLQESKKEEPPKPIINSLFESKQKINRSANGDLKFCINCGARIYTGNKFCIGCGNKL